MLLNESGVHYHKTYQAADKRAETMVESELNGVRAERFYAGHDAAIKVCEALPDGEHTFHTVHYIFRCKLIP